jgi:uncharacterized protein YfaS (alpha-2-macroglobulin family)
MYWANNRTNCFMTQSAVATHTFIMEAFNEAGAPQAEMDAMKLWLLKQKQTQYWESVPATVNAVEILLKSGSDWLVSSNDTRILLDDQPIAADAPIPGGGIRKIFKDKDSLANLRTQNLVIGKSGPAPAWGAFYRQYFEDLDKITASGKSLQIDKTLITSAPDRPLQKGDRVIIRLTVRTDRDLEFVQLKDLRASCFEPADPLSTVHWKQGVAYYQSPRDASVNFFFPSLPKGTYVFEYAAYITAPGNYSGGIASLQCLYAPEFVSHTAGERVEVQ